MKNYLMLLVVATSALIVSCNNEQGGLSATAKKNKEVNDAIMKAYESGDFSKMGDYIAADAVDHGGDAGDVKGLDSIVSEMKRYRSMVTDMKSSLIQEMVNDEYVIYWANMSGIMEGQPIAMSSVDVSKFKDGKAVEHWVFMDPKDVMKMMPSTMPPMSDSTGHSH